MQDKIKQYLKGVAPILPVIAVNKAEHIVPIAEGLMAGGIGSLEITLRTAAGREAIALARKQFPDLVVCAGTVTSGEQVAQLADDGVDFLVTPGLTPALLKTANDLKMPVVPGVASPSEVMLGLEYGLEMFKLFPATVVGGMGMLKAMGGPFPNVRFCPTGGLTPDTFTDFLALKNVFCVGGSWLVVNDADGTPDTRAIEQVASKTLAKYNASLS
ncbi:MAG: bifunctional 4-hydroxy-2-oxoglutarate aldolase/2-dehydro-3-deoxy-phosphogluconate aldolase [Gammaproteobacteria bacterium]|nr:bifunctional 4-hydroxy-2-oxoglutarate aldolase/2-dehydro-3-deoxy-phosphogluconate aldolase [Gammaproteobacteria bacterium]